MNTLMSILQRIRKSAFWGSVAVLVSGTALAQLIGIFTTPIVSRLYDPAAFGGFAIIVSTASIISNIVTLGLNSSVMVSKTDEECDDVFMVAFFTMLFLDTFALAGILVLSHFIKLFDSGFNYLLGCIFVYLLVIINNLKGMLDIYANRKKLNRVLFYNILIGALATLFITIPLGFLKTGSFGLITASIIAVIIAIVQMLFHANPFKRIPSKDVFINVYKKNRDFIFFQYPSNFIETFAVQLPNQVLSAVFGNANLGAYSMNEKILGIPSRLIGTPINSIYFRTASEYNKAGRNLADFTYSLVTKIMLLALIPVLITVIWSRQIFVWVLGPNWGEAGKMAGFLIIQYVFMFCSNCTSYCRVAIGKQRVNLVVSIIRLFMIGLSLYAGIKIFGEVFNTIILFSLGTSFYLIIDMLINFICMGRNYVKYATFALVYISAILVVILLLR